MGRGFNDASFAYFNQLITAINIPAQNYFPIRLEFLMSLFLGLQGWSKIGESKQLGKLVTVNAVDQFLVGYDAGAKFSRDRCLDRQFDGQSGKIEGPARQFSL